jgi:esterase/lipase superfamily enzyme
MRRWLAAALVGIGACLGGCTLDDSGPVHSVFRPETGAASHLKVIYVTDRAADPAAGGGFGGKWAGAPSCGVAEVVLPAAPAGGETVWGYVAKTTPVTCAGAGQGPAGRLAGAMALIAAEAEAKGCRSAFLFVHGFHTGFDGSVLRAAQIAHDAQTGCAAVAFSWTSEIKLDRYGVDQERSSYAQPLLAEFLRELSESGLKVSVLGHSMGARMATATLAGMAQSREPPAAGFVDELVLAAADIGVEGGNDDFSQLMADAGRLVKRTTVYVSSGDAVLLASRQTHGGVPRLGRETDFSSPGDGVLDIIDATSVPADLLGHSYYAMSYEAVYDMTLALKGVALSDRLRPLGPWPATLVQGQSGARIATERRPRLISRILLRLVP